MLRSNLELVFNERDAARRTHAVAELYTEDAVLYEPANVVVGRSAIADVASKLLEHFGPTFRFTPEAPSVGYHGLGARWRAGPADGPVVVSATDAAQLLGSKIAKVWVLLNPPPR